VSTAVEAAMAASVITLVRGIERVGAAAPAALAFKGALRRKGAEADAAGGLAALGGLLSAVADADPMRADTRTAIIRATWADLLQGPNGGTRS
jgi:hypothetical protein